MYHIQEKKNKTNKNTMNQQLISAALSGHLENVKSLLDEGADVNGKGNCNSTALILAAQKGHLKIVRLLIKRGADIEAKDNSNSTPLLWAAQNGHLEIVRLLIGSGAHMDAKDNFGNTPLVWAARYGYSEIKRLLNEKIRMNQRNEAELLPPKRFKMNEKSNNVRNLNTRPNPYTSEAICSELWKNRDATGDIKFKVEGVEISAHKAHLAAVSPKFERQFFGDSDDKDKKVIDVNDNRVTAASFEEFLQFFYLNEIHLHHENIEGVIFLAKESLVDEIYDECVKYLHERLSIKNVCLSYNLALLYVCEDLVKSCEQLIQTKLDDVLVSDGFNNGSRSNILNLVSHNCKATIIFDACISWAKNYCARNGMNGENDEDLRIAFGDELYKIKFGKMTIDEFTKYFETYPNLFPNEESNEIFSLIAKVSDFEPKWFIG